MGERRSVHAATIAEAFRLTVEDDADRIAVRTKDDEIAWTWVKGHSGDPMNDLVDRLAVEASHRVATASGDAAVVDRDPIDG